jgi:hypothetical protein
VRRGWPARLDSDYGSGAAAGPPSQRSLTDHLHFNSGLWARAAGDLPAGSVRSRPVLSPKTVSPLIRGPCPLGVFPPPSYVFLSWWHLWLADFAVQPRPSQRRSVSPASRPRAPRLRCVCTEVTALVSVKESSLRLHSTPVSARPPVWVTRRARAAHAAAARAHCPAGRGVVISLGPSRTYSVCRDCKLAIRLKPSCKAGAGAPHDPPWTTSR